jgi:hypothetical protein
MRAGTHQRYGFKLRFHHTASGSEKNVCERGREIVAGANPTPRKTAIVPASALKISYICGLRRSLSSLRMPDRIAES